MEVKTVQVKDYLTKSNLPSSDYVINPYVGCTHGCKYCYACFMKRFTGHREEWGSFLDVKQCSKPIAIDKLKGKKVFLSSVTDCYNEFEETYGVTRKILEQLVSADCSLSIGTKSKLILRDLDLLKQFKDLKVSFSINTLDEDFKNDMDNASSIEDRIHALQVLHENGIYTVIFMSPIFPLITDFKEIVEKTKAFVNEYWFENLNLRGSYKQKMLDYVLEKFPQFYGDYEKIYLKGDKGFWSELSKEINEYCDLNNIRYINFFHHEKLVKAKKDKQLEAKMQ
jgi:DNA repair photolyase